MGQEQHHTLAEAAEPILRQAELPAGGTVLNPVEESWAFTQYAAAAPEGEWTNRTRQGE
jgi:hypothetical protein